MLANEQPSNPRKSNSNILDLAEFVGHLRVRQAHGPSSFETFLNCPCCSSIKSWGDFYKAKRDMIIHKQILESKFPNSPRRSQPMTNTSICPTPCRNLPRRQEICNCSCPLPNPAYDAEKLVRQATFRTVQLEVVVLDSNIADPYQKMNRKTAIPSTQPFDAPLLHHQIILEGNLLRIV
jgi:hypothetical protein